MAAKKAPARSIKKAPSKARASKPIAITGDSRVRSLQFGAPKPTPSVVETVTATVPKRTKAKQPKPTARVVKSPVLVSVSLNENGTGTVARYAGLFFVVSGILFASHALSTLYVETEFIADSNAPLLRASLQRAEIISAPQVITPPSVDAVSETVPVVASATDSASTSEDVLLAASGEEEGGGSIQLTSPVEESSPLVVQDEYLRPQSTLSVSESDSTYTVLISVLQAQRVEVYAVPLPSTREWYVGTAAMVTDGSWSGTFESTTLPEGDYRLFARIYNTYGAYESDFAPLTIDNVSDRVGPSDTTDDLPPPTPADESNLSTTTAESPDAVRVASSEFDVSEPPHGIARDIIKLLGNGDDPLPVEETTSSSSATSSIATKSDMNKPALAFLLETEQEYSALLLTFSTALRGGDSSAVSRMRERIQEFVRQRLDRIGTDLIDSSDDAAIPIVRDRLTILFSDELTRIKKRENMLITKFGEEIARDGDRDGVSDYDERNTYRTDSSSADTDSDGFIDSAEIFGGYDPLDGRSLTVVASQSVRTDGEVRPEVLSVSDLQVIAQNDSTSPAGALLLSGVALPSSFVTISIFSEPIVATVRARDDGSWSYLFDKKLDDGQHEIFASMTDNAGSIIAKSRPFTFVKDGDTYLVGSAEAAVPLPAQSDRLFSDSVFILVNALGVIMLGLLLLIISVHFSRRNQNEAPVPAGSVV